MKRDMKTNCNCFKTFAFNRVFVLVFLLVCQSAILKATVWHVKTVASGTASGDSWTNASGSLQGMINGATAGDTIWVAAGTYLPTLAPDGVGTNTRDKSFYLSKDLKIFGGFTGAISETDLGDRDWAANVTTLSGDLGTLNNNTDNSYHVFITANLTNAAIIDGFTIKGGNANGSSAGLTFATYSYRRDVCGGIDNVLSSPTIRNLIITANYGTYAGGMYNLNASPKIINTVFWANSSTEGAGMYNNTSNTTVTNCTFYGNTSSGNYGGIFSGSSNISIINSIFQGNSQAGSISVAGADIGGSSHTVTYSMTQQNSSYSSGTGIINNQDPLFEDAANGNFALSAGSPAIDMGNNTAWTNTGLNTDILGNVRPQNGTVDIGAFEFNVAVTPILYVDKDATGGANNGTSWANAYTNLQDAIDATAIGNQVWVAEGTYYPTASPDGIPTNTKDQAFHFDKDIEIYGGFAGTETQLSQRIWNLHKTILSGDFKGDDEVSASGATLSISNNTENAYHVMITANLTNAAIIDGLTITGGSANGSTFGYITYALKNFYFDGGGGMVNISSSPNIANLTFIGNAADDGGGIFNYDSSSPIITNSNFSHNLADDDGGGGLFNSNSSPIIINSIFSGNSADNSDGGGIYNEDSSSPIITNTTFSGNSADNGGGIYNSSSSPAIVNSIFWDNSQNGSNIVAGADIYNFSSNPTVTYCLTQKNSVHSSGTGIINDQNPLFVDAVNGDFRLLNGSPALDVGDNSAWTATGLSTDIVGSVRPQNEIVDIGAYEGAVLVERVFVDKDATNGNKDGLSWANAYLNLQDAIDNPFHSTEIWVAEGTYYPTITTDTVYTGSTSSLNPRDKAFLISSNIHIYGGFVGNETELSQRDWEAHETILSGDFNNDDNISGNGSSLHITNNTDNAYHVILVTTATSSILDGFTVKGGNANGPSRTYLDGNQFFRGQGGGIYVNIGQIQLLNLNIKGNYAMDGGGGLSINSNSGSTVLTNVKVLKNENDGVQTESALTISSSSFLGNKGRGIYLDGAINSIIRNSIFSENSSTGVYCNRSTTTFTNNTFYGNSGSSGGGIHTKNKASVIKNCIFWNNTVSGSNSSSGSDIFYEYTFSDQIPTVAYCLTQAGSEFSSGTGIINNQDPLFMDQDEGDFRILAGSPVIDVGDNAAISGVSTDIAGNARIQNSIVDLGAYEGTSIPAIIYVDRSASSGTKNGASWANAYVDLQDAIDNPYGTTEIWVAKGTYLPTKDHTGNATSTDPRDKNFHMGADKQLYGGFTGIETELAQRDWKANPTILSGDLDYATEPDTIRGSGNTLSITGNYGNAFHVLITANLTSSGIIDGFTIKGGSAKGEHTNINFGAKSFYRTEGGGMNNANSSPLIRNMIFSGNTAFKGGGIENFQSSPTMSNIIFSNNLANTAGGGIDNYSSLSLVITTVIFSGNSAGYGGGMSNDNSSPIITNATFFGNSASVVGGGIKNSTSSSPIVKNTIFWKNDKNGATNVSGADIENLTGSQSAVSNSITQENSIYSSGTGIINNQNPQFTDAANGDLSLNGCSPAINTGDNSAWTATGISTDLAGNARPFGTSVVDMGAYEFQGNNPFTNAIYVKYNATGDNDGSTWADAYTDLQDAIDNQCGSLPIWVAVGTYYPTAGTDRTISFAIPDGVKLYGGFAGTETLLAQRDWTTHETILSGDIGTQNDNTDNSYHVVYTKNVSSETLMDGFTVSDGKAEVLPLRNGGGWLNDGSGLGNSSSPTLSNCTFLGNSAIYGGAIYNNGTDNGVSSPTLSNCTFLGNSAAEEGGAIYNHGINLGVSSPTLSNCTFLGNSAVDNGGAMYFSGDGGSVKAVVINCTFQDNGNDHIGYDDADQGAQPHFVNCTFTGATAYAINISYWDSGEAPLDFTNCIFWGNNGDILGGEEGTDNARLNIRNSIVEEAAFASANNNINQNPLFVDAANGIFALKCNSPAINQGTATGAPTTDITGFVRVGLPDMGAYEYGYAEVENQISNGKNPSLSGVPILKASSKILNTNNALYRGINNVQLLPGFSVAPAPGQASVFRAEIGGGCL